MIAFTLAIAGFTLYLGYWFAALFLKGAVLVILGLILGLVFFLFALRTLHLTTI